MNTILNIECGPIWEWDPTLSVARMVADDQGVRRLKELQEDDPLRILLEKLVKLSPAEDGALVDICERIWRGHGNPLL
ncbi:hypothetical protein [Inhella sp.]|uniref:hypothetical protein n=1 Tax=Inhella sp. TaxID=1921806 RepID=UPI0035ADFF64